MIDSKMGGEDFKVGRFAHTLRMRLMREHLGVDVDELEAQELNSTVPPLTSKPISRDSNSNDDSATAPLSYLGSGAEEHDRVPPLSNHQRSSSRRMKEKESAYAVSPINDVDPFCFKDPLSDAFYQDIWLANSARNTKIYRKVFRSVPDE